MGEHISPITNPFTWLFVNVVILPIVIVGMAVNKITEKVDSRAERIYNKKNYQSLPQECKEIVDISRKI